MADIDSGSKKRKRGIKASRAKLEEARAQAGFKTQAALAEAIADAENLEAAPKDIVSKIFREIPVSPSSIQRVASVMGVEAYTLYKSAAEEKRENPVKANEETPKSTSRTNIKTILVFLFIAIVGVSATIVTANYLSLQKDLLINDKQKARFAYKKPQLGKFSVVIDTDEKSRELLDFPTLAAQLENNYTLSDYFLYRKTSNSSLQPNQILSDLQSDFFLSIEAIEHGEFTSVIAYLFADSTMHNAWSITVRRSYLEQNIALFIDDLVSTIKFETGLDNRYSSKFAEKTNNFALLDFMKGRTLLDDSEDIENIKKAQHYFLNATRSSPEFASAYAGLCETLLEESWLGNEKLLLEKAQVACDKAINILPNHPYVVAVNFFLLRRTGRVDAALRLHNSIDNSWDKGVDYIHALSVTKFEAYRQHPENNSYLKDAKDLVHKAIKMDPNFWKSYNTLGLIEFSTGNTQKAIDALAIAIKHNPNKLAYANLGTLSFCQNNEEKALYFYAESLKLSPDHYIANEMIGLIHYFNKNYQASYEYRKKALDSLDNYGVHHSYGTIADSAEKLQMNEEAKKYYQEAKRIIERDALRGNLTPTDEAIGLYYEIKMRLLNGENLQFDTDPLQQRINELSDMSDKLESTAIIRLALIHSYFKNFKRAKILLDTASERCPSYLKHPDLEYLYDKENTI